MKILFVASEAVPFIKTGGLADIAGTLPIELNSKKVETRVILPLYRCIPKSFKDNMTYITNIYVNIAWRKQYCGIFKTEVGNTTFYFIDNEFYFNGEKPYDEIYLDMEKFIFFSKAVLSILPTIDYQPDIIHCNDWQSAAIPVLLDTFKDNPFYQNIKTVMTIHNLKFQGRWGLNEVKDILGISDYYYTSDKLEYYKDANLLKGGCAYANKITTVSPSYAEEIKTYEYGEGLNGLMAARSNDLTGILNGISYDEWNPKNDKFIYKNYGLTNLNEGKAENKKALQAELGLTVDENVMMFAIVSRLTDQKGLDLITQQMENIAAANCQVVILGTGDKCYEDAFKHFAWKYPNKVYAGIYFSNEMSHKIYAAADAFLMPSRFEPCGLSQIISLRYGTLPIVRETGGLRDTVAPYNEFTGDGTGFSFANYSSEELLNTIYYALKVYYEDKKAWTKLAKNAMKADFSWKASTTKYIDLYNSLCDIVKSKNKTKTSFTSRIKKDAEKTPLVKVEVANEVIEVVQTSKKKASPKKTKKEEKKSSAKSNTSAKVTEESHKVATKKSKEKKKTNGK